MTTDSYNAAADFIDRHVAEGRADKTAVTDDRGSYSFAELQRGVNRAANALEALGIVRETRVALIMLDSADFIHVFFGAIKAGIVPVCLNTLLNSEQYRYVLNDCRAEALFISAPLLARVEPILGELPFLKHVVVSDGEAGAHRALADLLAGASDRFEPVATHPDEIAFWLYSSGSTGMPKGVKHRQTSMRQTVETYAVQVLGLKETDTVFSAAKLFFAYGLGNAMSFPLGVGASIVLMAERPTPQSCFAAMKRTNPTIFYGVPTLYAAMLADKTCTPENGSNALRQCVSAGEALPEETGKRWRQRFGIDIIEGVGSTEMLHIYLSNFPNDLRYGTQGKPVPGYAIRLIDEHGNDVPDGEIGEMLVSGDSAADGYWNNRAKTLSTFAGPWTWTGDKFIRDADGFYRICGRSDDMFKVSGIWVSPFEVEAALIIHDSVLEAAVVPVEDEDGLVKPKAYVVFKEGITADAALFDVLKEHVKAHAGPWKYPRWIEPVADLPKTATGKIQRFRLRG